MNQQQPSPGDALNYLAQLSNDLAATLPPSARGPTLQAAQSAITLLEGALGLLPGQAAAEAAQAAPADPAAPAAPGNKKAAGKKPAASKPSAPGALK